VISPRSSFFPADWREIQSKHRNINKLYSRNNFSVIFSEEAEKGGKKGLNREGSFPNQGMIEKQERGVVVV